MQRVASSAIRDPNPVIFLENEILYGRSFDVPIIQDFTITPERPEFGEMEVM